MIYINAYSMINPIGSNIEEIKQSLILSKSGITQNKKWMEGVSLYLGEINKTLPEIDDTSNLQRHNSRNNQLLLACLKQIKEEINDTIARFGKDRIAIILGTSTSGISEGETALQQFMKHTISTTFDYQQQCFSDPCEFLSEYLQITGPSYTISTACSSSARAISTGATLIENGIVDAAIVGGADTLCHLSIYGFKALGALSLSPCMPFAKERSGINIGEAAGLMILSKKQSNLTLYGWGSSSDAWHISAPHPEGEGAERSMRKALNKANMSEMDIGYINLHGTGTELNDSAESKAVSRIFSNHVPCSSTKHLTGHTLGAAGITELGISALIIDHDLPLPHQHFNESSPIDENLAPIKILQAPANLLNPFILSNSFAFGGNNTSLIIGRSNG